MEFGGGGRRGTEEAVGGREDRSLSCFMTGYGLEFSLQLRGSCEVASTPAKPTVGFNPDPEVLVR